MPIYPSAAPVDLLDPSEVRYIAPARAALLREVNDRQHAVMTAFGGPVQVWTGYQEGFSSPETRKVLFRVPPGTQTCRVGALVRRTGSGASLVEVRVGAGNWVELRPPPSSGGAEDLTWLWSGGDAPDSANVSRRLGLRATPALSWATITVELRCTRAEVYAIACAPEHLPL